MTALWLRTAGVPTAHSFALFVNYDIYISYSGKLLALRQCKKLRKSVRVVGADLTIIITFF